MNARFSLSAKARPTRFRWDHAERLARKARALLGRRSRPAPMLLGIKTRAERLARERAA